MQPKTTQELQKQFMSEHAAEFRHFARLLLTTSAGMLALMAGLASQRQPGVAWPDLAETAFQAGWALLAVSLLSGLAVQWLEAMRLLDDAEFLKQLEIQEEAQGTRWDEPRLFRRLPQRRLAWYFRVQTGCFLGSVVALTAALLWR
ncbi:hypothetical protein [Delftia sp. RIT313]|uniref:hypothetical protein n=1 Tax=Delftia sp. RIT313 TaxID=1468410 RepID=UPI001267CDFA|nr:hypothetical protein [Delftia sp. RIT313]